MKKAPISRCDNEVSKPNCFKITTTERAYYAYDTIHINFFCRYTSSEEDCDAWLLALQEAAGDSIIVRKKADLTESQLQRANVFYTISEAIEVAKDGEKILIYPGKYHEQLIITKVWKKIYITHLFSLYS